MFFLWIFVASVCFLLQLWCTLTDKGKIQTVSDQGAALQILMASLCWVCSSFGEFTANCWNVHVLYSSHVLNRTGAFVRVWSVRYKCSCDIGSGWRSLLLSLYNIDSVSSCLWLIRCTARDLCPLQGTHTEQYIHTYTCSAFNNKAALIEYGSARVCHIFPCMKVTEFI